MVYVGSLVIYGLCWLTGYLRFIYELGHVLFTVCNGLGYGLSMVHVRGCKGEMVREGGAAGARGGAPPQYLTPTSTKNNAFLKLILLETSHL